MYVCRGAIYIHFQIERILYLCSWFRHPGIHPYSHRNMTHLYSCTGHWTHSHCLPGWYIHLYLWKKKKTFLAHNSFFAAKICRLNGSCWKKGIESTRDNLTSTHCAVSLVTSYTAADVETLRVGAQGVGVALVKCVTVAFINVWIYVLQRCKWKWQ